MQSCRNKCFIHRPLKLNNVLSCYSGFSARTSLGHSGWGTLGKCFSHYFLILENCLLPLVIVISTAPRILGCRGSFLDLIVCLFDVSLKERKLDRQICFFLWCTNSQEFGYLVHVTCFEKPSLLGADGVHLSEKGKTIFRRRLAKLVKRTFNSSFLRRGTSIHPIQTGLMLCPATGVQSQE